MHSRHTNARMKIIGSRGRSPLQIAPISRLHSSIRKKAARTVCGTQSVLALSPLLRTRVSDSQPRAIDPACRRAVCRLFLQWPRSFSAHHSARHRGSASRCARRFIIAKVGIKAPDRPLVNAIKAQLFRRAVRTPGSAHVAKHRSDLAGMGGAPRIERQCEGRVCGRPVPRRARGRSCACARATRPRPRAALSARLWRDYRTQGHLRTRPRNDAPRTRPDVDCRGRAGCRHTPLHAQPLRSLRPRRSCWTRLFPTTWSAICSPPAMRYGSATKATTA